MVVNWRAALRMRCEHVQTAASDAQMPRLVLLLPHEADESQAVQRVVLAAPARPRLAVWRRNRVHRVWRLHSTCHKFRSISSDA